MAGNTPGEIYKLLEIDVNFWDGKKLRAEKQGLAVGLTWSRECGQYQILIVHCWLSAEAELVNGSAIEKCISHYFWFSRILYFLLIYFSIFYIKKKLNLLLFSLLYFSITYWNLWKHPSPLWTMMIWSGWESSWMTSDKKDKFITRPVKICLLCKKLRNYLSDVVRLWENWRSVL